MRFDPFHSDQGATYGVEKGINVGVEVVPFEIDPSLFRRSSIDEREERDRLVRCEVRCRGHGG